MPDAPFTPLEIACFFSSLVTAAGGRSTIPDRSMDRLVRRAVRAWPPRAKA